MGSSDGISEALSRKEVDPSCRRCGKDEWISFSRDAIIPDTANQVETAGGTAATVRACNYCGLIELYNPGLLAHELRDGIAP